MLLRQLATKETLSQTYKVPVVERTGGALKSALPYCGNEGRKGFVDKQTCNLKGFCG